MYEFYGIFNRNHPAVSTKHLLQDFARNPTSEGESWNPLDDGFDIAIRLGTNSNGTLQTLDPSYGSLSIVQ